MNSSRVLCTVALALLTLIAAQLASAAEAYSPAKGSKEEKAIIATARATYEERFKKRLKLTNHQMTVQDGWAGVSLWLGGEDQGEDYDLWHALLRGSGSNWKIVGAFRARDITKGNDPEARLRARHPTIPAAVWDAFEVQ